MPAALPPKLPILGLTQAKLAIKDSQLAHPDHNVQRRAATELARLAATRSDGFKADGTMWLPKSQARIDVGLVAMKTTEGDRMVQHALISIPGREPSGLSGLSVVKGGVTSPDFRVQYKSRGDFLGLDRKTVKALEAALGLRTAVSRTVRAAEREAATSIRENAATRIATLAAARADGLDWHNTTFESGAYLEVKLKDGRQVASVTFLEVVGLLAARSITVEGRGWAHRVLGFAAKDLNELDLKLSDQFGRRAAAVTIATKAAYGGEEALGYNGHVFGHSKATLTVGKTTEGAQWARITFEPSAKERAVYIEAASDNPKVK